MGFPVWTDLGKSFYLHFFFCHLRDCLSMGGREVDGLSGDLNRIFKILCLLHLTPIWQELKTFGIKNKAFYRLFP